MSYGTIWGTGWGGSSTAGAGPLAPFHVVSAQATSSQSFSVTFSKNPVVQTPIGATDASNLANITLTRLDTGAVIPLLAGGAVPGDPLTVEYLMLAVFPSTLITYETASANLVSEFGEILADPKTAQFNGMPSSALPAVTLRPLLDYFNPQAAAGLINGGLEVGSNADYALEGGVSLMRKLIIRRILTAQAEFYHLADQPYGLGVEPKQIYTAADLIQFRRQLEKEVVKEAEIDSVKVRLTLKTSHELDIQVSARLKTIDQQITISLPIDLTGTTNVVA